MTTSLLKKSVKSLGLSVQTSNRGDRLDRFLIKHLPEKSRAKIQELITDGFVLLNQKLTKPSYRLKGSEKIQILLRISPPTTTIKAEAIPLDIVYEDSDIAVVNKEAGMVVHHGAGVKSGTLVNALLYQLQHLSSAGGNDRPGIVHRLDKQTSGLMVVARNDFSHHHLSRQFQSREVVKRYTALVHGIVRNESGTIENPIGRDRIRRTKMSTRAKISRNAHTAYRVLERFSGLTLLEVHLKTGRTHQIRVHLSSIKHPVVGDTLYGAPSKFNFSHFNFNSFTPTRNFLHSSFLSFCHPKNLKLLTFSSALPEELEYLLKCLRK